MMYSPNPHLSYTQRPRFRFKKEIIKNLRQTPLTKAELKKACKVPPYQSKSFDRALNELYELDVIRQDEKTQKIYAYGHEPPETVQVTVRTENLDLTIPTKREQAVKIIEKDKLIKSKKEVLTTLKETGLIEEKHEISQ